MKKLKTGVYGVNGHQISPFLEGNANIEFIAAACVPETFLNHFASYKAGKVKVYDSLDAMLENAGLDLVSLCSPRRADEANDAIKALRAGVSVYAEKPCALTEHELDAILAAEADSPAEFHEIADTAFAEPYLSAKALIERGEIGQVVQIYAQKSYPNNFAARPEDSSVDGGITRQAGIHAARFIEHVCGVRIADVRAFETTLGAPPEKPKLTTAVSVAMTLENGGVASMCVNYFNPKAFGLWGNESLRVFGTKGVLEITDGGRRTHLWNETGDCGEIPVSETSPKPFLDQITDHLLYQTPLPFDRDTELHPLRAVIRMAEKAEKAKGETV